MRSKKYNNSTVYEFLVAFFALFEAHIVSYEVKNKKIFGVVGWQDEHEQQNFSWATIFDDEILHQMEFLCQFLKNNELMRGDSIRIAENALIEKLSQSSFGYTQAKKLIDLLCQIEIKMIDDGKETDSFFIHF